MKTDLPPRCTEHRSAFRRGCETCKTRARAYSAKRYRQRAYGANVVHAIDANPVREHIRMLIDRGATMRWIAGRAGVPHRTISELMSLPARKITPDSALFILGVAAPTEDGFVGRDLVDALGSRRMLQALTVAGYGVRSVAVQMGRSAHAAEMLRRIREGQTLRITRRTRDEIERAYEKLCWEMGPSLIATRFGFARGWEPCDAWSFETINDPKAEPYQHQALDAQYVDEEKLRRVRTGVLVDGIRYRFIDCNWAEQLTLLREHLDAGGKIRGFRDRNRPAPMELLRRLELEIRATQEVAA